jgi:hypothetical protein
MLALLAIFLLLLTPILMVTLHLLRPRVDSYQWLIAVLGALLAWLAMLLARLGLPYSLSLLAWQPEALFPTSPSLLVDNISWPFAFALASLSLSLMLTSVARLQAEQPAPPSDHSLVANAPSTPPNWRPWAAYLALTSLGMVAALAGNLLTLLLAWVALDILELLVLLVQLSSSQAREQVVVALSARLGGIAMLLLAGIQTWVNNETLTFAQMSLTPSSASSLFLLLAAGLRLGVLPLHLPFTQELPIRRGLGSMLRLAPAAASLVLLARIATIGVAASPATPFLLALAALAAIYGAVAWAGAADELSGRPFWIISTASLAVVAAVRSAEAALAWGMACLLVGGFIFSFSLRRRLLLLLAGLAWLGLTALPYTPSWPGADIYQWPTQAAPGSLIGRLALTLALLLAHALLLGGFARHALRPAGPASQPASIEHWIWLVYPAGLALLSLAHFGLGWQARPDSASLPLLTWLGGLAACVLALLLWIPVRRYLRRSAQGWIPNQTQFVRQLGQLFSLSWLYRLLWSIFRQFSRLLGLVSSILEGEGGLLWAFVLLVLIFAFLRQSP